MVKHLVIFLSNKKMIKTDSSLNLLGSHYVKVALHKKVECNLKVTLKEE